MFENVVGQSAVLQLGRDIEVGRLAPAMLFHGPQASGKGTSALELARYISCENPSVRAAWNCNCPACLRHKLLLHPDLLCLGSRLFSAEIAASSAAFLQEPQNAGGRMLFVRSVRKLLARFNPALWEDEPKLSKINPFVSSIEEDLDALGGGEKETGSGIEKTAASIVEDALKLESEGITDTIPIAQIRRCASWAHLHPSGKGKILIIENADRMQEGARNSLLKLLEEPPDAVTLILTTTRQKVLLPTILSRLRPYRFAARDEESAKEVIRRVFRNSNPSIPGLQSSSGNFIAAYLDGFLPVPADTLGKLAAFFAASAAKKAALLIQKKKKEVPETVAALGRHNASIAEEAGLGSPSEETAEAVSTVMKGASGFEPRYLFSRFLQSLLERAGESCKQVSCTPSEQILYHDLWRECTAKADSAVSIYNQSPALALERLFADLSRGMA